MYTVECRLRRQGCCAIRTCRGRIEVPVEDAFLDEEGRTFYLASCYRPDCPHTQKVYHDELEPEERLRPLFKPKGESDYTDVVAFVREVRADRRLHLKGFPSAVAFIRFQITPDSPYYKRAKEACTYVDSVAAHEKDGVEAAWRTVAQQCKPSHARNQHKDKKAPPGKVPILDRDIGWSRAN